jgi:hypothetical protein
MILPAGLAIRFKGNNADRYASEFADSLRGHCSRHGSKIVITRSTHMRVKLFPNGVTDKPPILDLSPFRSNEE